MLMNKNLVWFHGNSLHNPPLFSNVQGQRTCCLRINFIAESESYVTIDGQPASLVLE
jgi:hypothetical protein